MMLVGGLKGLAGRSEIQLEPHRRTMSVSEAILELCRRVANSDFERVVIDPLSKTVGPNVIVLVNNRDISVLRGLKTQISSDDTITLIPVSHGG